MEEVSALAPNPTIVQLAQRGETAAFEEIYREYRPLVAGYLYRMVGDPDVAADLAQDVFVQAFRSIGRTQPGLNIKPWLFKIATNAALSYHRRRRLISWLPIGGRGEDAPVAGPEEGYASREELVDALGTLPADQRACLLLSARDGFTYEQIGHMLGISAGTARTRAYRARLALERILPDHGEAQ
jgi:RNA polymerase sigma-70 factor (ECF subfamily)